MSDSRKYYYLKLKADFFNSEEMIVLEGMPDGYLYCNILLKLYLRSLKDKGRLMFKERIPYNSKMLADITRHSVGTIEKAIQIFESLGLIDILDSGAIYLMDIQNYIGESSTEADRKREYRTRIEKEKGHVLDNVQDNAPQEKGQMSQMIEDKCPPISGTNLHQTLDFKDKDFKDKEKEEEKEESPPDKPDASHQKNAYGEFGNVILTEAQYQNLDIYCKGKREYYLAAVDGWLQQNPANKRKAKDHYATIQNWYRRDNPSDGLTKINSSMAQKSKFNNFAQAPYDIEAIEKREHERIMERVGIHKA